MNPSGGGGIGGTGTADGDKDGIFQFVFFWFVLFFLVGSRFFLPELGCQFFFFLFICSQ